MVPIAVRCCRLRCPLAAVVVSGAALLPLGAEGHTPDSPEVKAAVVRALKYLATADDAAGRLGAKALAARVLAADGQRDHAKVKEAVAAIRQELAAPTVLDIYSHGLAIVLLAELDPFGYRAELEALVARLAAAQKPHGGWGYPHQGTGDTSMTQYAVLALWTAAEAGIETPLATWEKAAQWLLRTQDPSGAFGYQAVVPNNDELMPQSGINPTLAAAGLASLYLCGDHLGLLSLGGSSDPRVPGVFKPVERAEASRQARTEAVDRVRLGQAIQRAAQWCAAHEKDRPPQYLHYYWYTIERMQTFGEAAQAKRPAAAAWYDDGVQYLLAAQRDDGSWQGTEDLVPATAFAVLFLTRSTRKVLRREQGLGDGTLVGGRGLPPAAGDVALRLGKIVARPLAGPAEELLARMEDPSHPDFLRAVEGLEELTAQADAPLLSRHAEQLRRLAAGPSPEARAAALRALSRARNVDDAPLLIEALQDGDSQVAEAAREGLRFLARRFTSEPAGELSEAQRQAERAQWKSWYQRIRPGAVFED